MNESKPQFDFWILPTVLMWVVYFLAGLDPELLYNTVRDAGWVVTQNAMVNSPHLVTLAFAGYLGLFAYHRCLESGLPKMDAKARALQVGILGLLAFLSFSLSQLRNLSYIPDQTLRVVVIAVSAVKLVAWFTLLGMVLRYYLLGHTDVFANIGSMFPSTYRQEKEPLGDRSSVAWIDSPRKDDPAQPPSAPVPIAPPSRREVGDSPHFSPVAPDDGSDW
ncbi:MAG: hypothetical protein AMXMBFR4_19630 [Candidatus Hydrogenedentota bacterium]